MNKRELLLAAMAAGGKSEHSPVQIQKLIFIIEKNVSDRLGGTAFEFKPYDYGPFDSTIYDELRTLQSQGLVTSNPTSRGWVKHSLTEEGLQVGTSLSGNLDPEAQKYIQQVSEFVRTLSFSDLVSAVYQQYPEMKVNSVFRG